jgi:glutathione S-transferase
MGEVPVLDADGTILTQSGVIQDWVMDETGKLCGDGSQGNPARNPALDDLRQPEGLGHGGTAQVHDELPARGETLGRGQRLSRRAGSRPRLQVLEGELAHRDWLVGDSLTSADLACCGYLFYEEPFTFDRADYPAIDAWLTRIAATPGWKHPYDLMQRAFAAA